MSKIALRIYLVRHGETQENRDGVIQGQTDTELNEIGAKQARCLGEALKDVKISFAFSSDLKRAYNTAEAIMKHHDDIEIVKLVELRERAMGDMETKKFGKGMRLAILADETVEPSSSFSKRITTWWNKTILQSVLSKCKDDEELNVLVVTHAGVIHTLVQEMLGSRKLKAAAGVVVWTCINASTTVIELEHGSRQGNLVRYGGVAHLLNMDEESLEAAADQEIGNTRDGVTGRS